MFQAEAEGEHDSQQEIPVYLVQKIGISLHAAKCILKMAPRIIVHSVILTPDIVIVGQY